MSRTPYNPIHDNPLMRKQIREINQVVDAVNEQRMFSGVDGLDLSQLPGGVSIENNAQQFRQAWFYAVIVDAGPKNEPDKVDSKYWVREIRPQQPAGTTASDACSPYLNGASDALWGIATNLAEAAAETHTLPTVSASITSASVVPVGATIVKVWVVNATKNSTIANDYANTVWILEPISKGGDYFRVIVKQNGDDGTNPLYDVYEPSDTGYTSPLNDEPLAPICSRARWNGALVATAPPDGSEAIAFDLPTGIELWDLPETDETNDCSMTDLVTF